MSTSAFNVEHQNTNLASKIVAGMERISEAYKVLLWDHAKQLGVSPIQIQILIFLKYHKEDFCNVSYLAKEFNVSKPTISDAVKVLDKKELVNKNYSEIDKRAYTISVSRKGSGLVRKTENFAEPLTGIIDEFDEREQTKFFELLSKLIQKLNSSGVLQVQRNCYSCKYYKQNKGSDYCNLLEKRLLNSDIRLDCPEFENKL